MVERNMGRGVRLKDLFRHKVSEPSFQIFEIQSWIDRGNRQEDSRGGTKLPLD